MPKKSIRPNPGPRNRKNNRPPPANLRQKSSRHCQILHFKNWFRAGVWSMDQTKKKRGEGRTRVTPERLGKGSNDTVEKRHFEAENRRFYKKRRLKVKNSMSKGKSWRMRAQTSPKKLRGKSRANRQSDHRRKNRRVGEPRPGMDEPTNRKTLLQFFIKTPVARTMEAYSEGEAPPVRSRAKKTGVTPFLEGFYQVVEATMAPGEGG